MPNKLPRSKLRGIPQAEKFDSRLHSRRSGILQLEIAMAKKVSIVDFHHPAIRTVAKPVGKINQQTLAKIVDLEKALKTSKVPGVGIASNQIGQTDRIFLLKFGQHLTAFVNPEITSSSDKLAVAYEGCLSVPSMYGQVARPAQVSIRAQNRHGKTIKRTYKGLAARIFQHELDHINAKLFVDRVIEQKGELLKVVGRDKDGKDKLAKVEYPVI